MPNFYQRKSDRASWSEEALKEAIARVKAGDIGKREAEKYYGIPARTICRRIEKDDCKKKGLGPEGTLGAENEKRLVRHIQNLSSVGFAPDRQTVRVLAYKFAEKLNISHKFSKECEMAGYAWLNSFLRRNPELTIRQAEGLSVARGQGMNREDTSHFFTILQSVFEEHSLMDKPGHIFNVDESGFPLINKPGKVLTSKGSKSVHTLTPKERGENITLIGCFNAEGRYLPPVLIMKGVNKKPEFCDGLPAGSEVYMNPKSSYISSELFLRWFVEHFLPRKPTGKTVLILDGHSSHVNALEFLETAEKEDVVIVCLPSHTTQALQPLDRSFFGPLKVYYNKEATLWMQQHPSRNITRYQAGQLIGNAWRKAANVGNAVSGFEATGIFPLNSDAIPDHFFSISDASRDSLNISTACSNISSQDTDVLDEHANSSARPNRCSQSPGVSAVPNEISTQSRSIITTNSTPSTSKETPTKHLHDISPLPSLPNQKRKFKQSAQILTTRENLEILKEKKRSKFTPACPQPEHQTPSSKGVKRKKTSHKDHKKNASASESQTDYKSGDQTSSKGVKRRKTSHEVYKKNTSGSESQADNKSDDNICSECWENYYKTTSKVDWIQCSTCGKWLHETCTLYGSLCNVCGREVKRKLHSECKT